MKNLFWLSTYIIICAIFSSCSKDDDGQAMIPEGEKTNVKLSLAISSINAMGTNVNDNRTSVDNFWLLEFDQQGKNVSISKELRFSINSPEDIELVAGANMRVVVIANVDKSIIFQLGKQTYEQLKKAIYTIPINSANNIPLVGETTVSINKENQVLDPIQLSRIASELTFSITNSSADFKLTSISLKNISKMYYLSQGEIAQGNVADYSELPATVGEASYTYYIGENLMGSNTSIASDKDKVTDKLATFIEVVGERINEGKKEVATFKLFIGESPKDFNVKRNYSYSYTIALNLADANDKRITKEIVPLEGLAAEANCYMLDPASQHDLLIPVKRVNTYWGTDEGGHKTEKMLNDGNNQGKVTKWVARIITKDTPDNLFTFTIGQGTSANDYIGLKSTGKEGNAQIGIYDATNGEPSKDAQPLWSWHIWVTGYNPGGDINGTIPAIAQNPGKATVTNGFIYRFGGIDGNLTKDGSTQAMMDRNLGALAATPDAGAKNIGMFYQYGRKDPFMAEWDKKEQAGTSFGNPIYNLHLKTAKSPVTKEYAILNPDVFIIGGDNTMYKNWLDNNDTELWWKKSDEKTKTIYDPCPAGWRIPYKSTTYQDTDGEDVAGKGIYLYPKTLRMYYSFSGHLNPIEGKTPGGCLYDYGGSQNNWLGYYYDNPYNAGSCMIFPQANVDDEYTFYPVTPSSPDGKYNGYTIRCVKQ